MRGRLADCRRPDVSGSLADGGDQRLVHTVGRPRPEFLELLVERVDGAGLGTGKLHGFCHDGSQYVLHIERRVDRLADLAERAQLLNGLRQLAGARLHLVKQPHVLNGDHRLIGKCRHQLDLLLRKRALCLSCENEHPNGQTFAHERNAEHGAKTHSPLHFPRREFSIRENIVHMHRPGFEHRTSRDRATSHVQGPLADYLPFLRGESETRFDTVHRAPLANDPHRVGIAQACCRCGERIQHPLQVERRAADHLEHVGGGGLLLQRLAQIVGAPTELVKQPRVLDGNYRLVGKSCHQLDLFLRKWLGHISPHEDHPRDLALAQERNTKGGAVTGNLLSLTPGILLVGQDIGDVHHFCLQRRPSGHAAAIDRDLARRQVIPQLRMHLGCKAEACDPAKHLTLAFEQPGLIGVAQPRY